LPKGKDDVIVKS